MSATIAPVLRLADHRRAPDVHRVRAILTGEDPFSHGPKMYEAGLMTGRIDGYDEGYEAALRDFGLAQSRSPQSRQVSYLSALGPAS